MDLAQVVVQGLLHDCTSESRGREVQREITLQNLELNVANGAIPPPATEFWEDQLKELYSTHVY